MQNQTEEYGIENLKSIVAVTFQTANSLIDIDADQDGNISLPEGFSIATSIMAQYPKLKEAFPFLKKEWKDLSATEIDELKTYVIDELDLPTRLDNLEEILKRTINMIHYNYKYVKFMLEAVKKEKPAD